MSFQLKHTGYIIPEIYQEPYKQKPFAVTLRATSIGNLKNIKYLDANQDFITGTATLMTVITTCLNKLDYQIDIWDSVNTWEENMNVNLSPLVQAEIDQEAFIVEKDGRLQAKSCYEVLEQVLKPFVVNFFMDYGHWVIVPIELRGKARTVRVFDHTGTLQSSSMKDPTETFDRAPVDGNYCWVFSDQVLNNRPQLRDVQITYEHGENPSMIRKGDFNTTFVLRAHGFESEFIPDIKWETNDISDFNNFENDPTTNQPPTKQAVDTTGLKWKWNVHADIISPTPPELISSGAYYVYGGDDFKFIDTDNIIVVVNFSFRINTNRVSRQDEVRQKIRFRIGSHYLTSDGSWTMTPTDVEISTLQTGPSDYTFTDWAIISEEVPTAAIGGEIEARIYRPTNTNGSSTPDVIFSEYRSFTADFRVDGSEQDSTVYFGNRDIEVYSDEVTYDLTSADGPTSLHSAPFYFNSNLTDTWMRNDLDGSIIVIAIQQIFREYQTVSQVITGTQRSSKLFDRYLSEFDHTYTVNSGSYDERMCFFSGELLEVIDGDITVTVFKVEQDGTLTQVDPIYS